LRKPNGGAALQGCLACRPEGLRYFGGVIIIVLLFAGSAAAQLPQPVVSPPTASPDFLTRYDFQLSAAALGVDDQRFSWDTHFGGSLDVADYVVGRAAVRIDYEAVLGDEYRLFDPNQGNYTLEASSSGRIGEHTEVVGVFHHVSRHLSDRPKREAIAWNVAGARILHRLAVGTTTVDVDLEGGAIVQHSTVDYNWTSELNLIVRRPVNDRLGMFAQGSGQLFGVDRSVSDRGRQAGGFGEVGVRINGRAGAVELFAGFEHRVDAYPIGFESKHWALAGFRLLSR
jgi:hypothetical protein